MNMVIKIKKYMTAFCSDMCIILIFYLYINLILVYPEGLEPSTCRSVADRSIQLSYGYIYRNLITYFISKVEHTQNLI